MNNQNPETIFLTGDNADILENLTEYFKAEGLKIIPVNDCKKSFDAFLLLRRHSKTSSERQPLAIAIPNRKKGSFPQHLPPISAEEVK